MNRFLLIALLLSLSGCYLSEDVGPDQDVWEYALPRDVALSNQVLSALDQTIKDEEHGLINGLVIVKDDKLIFENYYTGGDRGSTFTIGRASFTIAVLLFQEFVNSGLITSIDDPIYKYLPEYSEIFENSPLKKEITFRHLLSHKSGLIWNESLVSSIRSSSDLQLMRNTADWTGHVLSKQLEASPGLRTGINSGTGIVISKIYQTILGDENLESLIIDKLFTPLSITNFEINKSPDGTLNLVDGISLGTFDFAKLGYLTLLEGRWKDKTRIFDRDWLLDTQTLTTVFSANYGIGLGWWIFAQSFVDQRLQGADDCIFISGGNGTNLYIMPSINMIVCVSAENNYNSSIYNPSLAILFESLRTQVRESGSR